MGTVTLDAWIRDVWTRDMRLSDLWTGTHVDWGTCGLRDIGLMKVEIWVVGLVNMGHEDVGTPRCSKGTGVKGLPRKQSYLPGKSPMAAYEQYEVYKSLHWTYSILRFSWYNRQAYISGQTMDTGTCQLLLTSSFWSPNVSESTTPQFHMSMIPHVLKSTLSPSPHPQVHTSQSHIAP